jgi:hypothetical protein
LDSDRQDVSCLSFSSSFFIFCFLVQKSFVSVALLVLVFFQHVKDRCFN